MHNLLWPMFFPTFSRWLNTVVVTCDICNLKLIINLVINMWICYSGGTSFCFFGLDLELKLKSWKIIFQHRVKLFKIWKLIDKYVEIYS
jgi:hypothetical protein